MVDNRAVLWDTSVIDNRLLLEILLGMISERKWWKVTQFLT